MTLANLPPLVTVFGGSGFVGRHVVRILAKRGYRIRVAVRRPDLAGFLQPLGNVGQISFAQANLRYRDSIVKAVEERLNAHNELEEQQIYALIGSNLSPEEQAQLASQVEEELMKHPPRFSTSTWINDE